MSAFGSPWKDIDDTRKGTPYVVDNDGWGWFLIFIVVSIPFLIIGSLIANISTWVCNHPILSLSIYLILTLLIGIIFYARSSMRHRICGIIATFLTIAPLGMGVALYAMPYVMIEGSFSSIFDWVLVAAFLFGIMFFIFSICNLLKNGLIHLVIGLVFFILAYFFITRLISSESNIISWEVIKSLYGI